MVVGCGINMLIHSQHYTRMHARTYALVHAQQLTAIQPIQLELHRITIEKTFRM